MPPRPACARCHQKKIKCNGSPNCRTCVVARVRCEPHTRARRALAYNDLRERMSWLESELTLLFGLDCASIPTHTPLAPLLGTNLSLAPKESRIRPVDLSEDSQGSPRDDLTEAVDDNQAASTGPEASDIGLLALNATGELRYLGPSSGSFFFNAASSLIRTSCPGPRHKPARGATGDEPGGPAPMRRVSQVTSADMSMTPETFEILISSFKMWIQPLYPLISDSELSRLQDTYLTQTTTATDGELLHMSLILALGAINLSNTIKEKKLVLSQDVPLASASALHEDAVGRFESSCQEFRPSLSLITSLLLFCIYSSYKATRYTQWQLAGLAMRMAVEMGLHSLDRNRQFSNADKDRRSRVFWTAYIVESSLAWNLGRPPSLDDAHITVEPLRATTGAMGFAVHHLQHRQIQSRIINSLYVTSPAHQSRVHDPGGLVHDLQTHLDSWRHELQGLFEREVDSAYPISYWERLHGGTTAVLHRPSPLIPHPAPSSLLRCITSSGDYIDHLLSTIRTGNVPLTWMLVQGLLFSGLTLLVVVRAHAVKILNEAGISFLLVDLPKWTRKCSTCLTIMRERWNDGLLENLESQFEAFAENTMEKVATLVVSSRDRSLGEDLWSAPGQPSCQTRSSQSIDAGYVSQPGAETLDPAGAVQMDPDNQTALMDPQWDAGTFFSDMVALDSSQELWDEFMGHSGFDILSVLGDDGIHFPSI